MQCLFCENALFTKVHTYTLPPHGEVKFASSSNANYFREIYKCNNCSHYISTHKMDLSNLYSGDYVSSTYKDEAGIKNTFDKIISLDAKKSDNAGRVMCINNFAKDFFKTTESRTLLDIGSGLGVFPYGMKNTDWDCTALDPDQRACEHLKSNIGVKVICADFLKVAGLGRYDCVSLNKVLEHVLNPIEMLAKAKEHIKANGFIYIEVPDGERACLAGFSREEFFIDHHHIFSLESLKLMAKKAGLRILAVERLQEPSTKYTFRAFVG